MKQFCVDGPVLLTLTEKDLEGEMGFTQEETKVFMHKLASWIQVTDTMAAASSKNGDVSMKVEEIVMSWTVDQV
eukprot:CAMPEP_0117694226 /NCGR_PEP_ID=MMETSP0804-20121206/27334_1 /TAXON_ID=1074897 /ORGANISM="Tetraselmis astigmatica, Strain CCMP880" /LENGTH=73 /DNA_ID=CAMNT_0005507899 /DNA_START=271 /DNA_END=488 /DNA_ORIENTATION=+